MDPHAIFLYSTQPLVLIVEITKDEWSVSSLTVEEKYVVNKGGVDKWRCDCRSFQFHTGVTKEGWCKHIVAVMKCLKDKVEIKKLDDILESEGL